MQVITGCDKHREFLMKPFVHYLRKYNPTIGLSIADFGMTPEMRKWCEQVAPIIDVDPPDTEHVYDTLMLKPKAMLQIPLESGLWLDNDVQVCGSLDSYRELRFAAQWNTATWNTGILRYMRDHPVMKAWSELKRYRGEGFAGGRSVQYKNSEHDEHVLLRAMALHPVRMHNLDWQMAGLFQHYHRKSSICIHWMGESEKQFYMRIFEGEKTTK